MLNLTIRFTGLSPASDAIDTLDVQFSGTQRAAVTHALALGGYGHDETVRERNYRLRHAASKIGAMLTEQICSQLREMGHAV